MKVDGNDGEIEWTSDKDESNKLFLKSFNVQFIMVQCWVSLHDTIRGILIREGVKMAV